jgi:hypothetical protein
MGMPSKIGGRLTYANITATLALVFAMSGGAVAATHYLLTSTRQISPRVLAALRGRAGAAGAKGAAGAPGASGATGAPGPEGKAGANGTSVTSRQFEGAAGGCMQGGSEFTAANGTTFACNGQTIEEKAREGPKPPPWPSSLPSKTTETGTWSFASAAAGLTRVSLSFTVPTAQPLEPIEGRGPVELLEPGEEDPLDAHPNCPGTVAQPRADPGFICVYAETLEAPLVEHGPVRTSGVVLVFKSNSASPEIDEGTWAVTAP